MAIDARFCPVCGVERWPDAAFCGRCRFAFEPELRGNPEPPWSRAPDDGPIEPEAGFPDPALAEPIEASDTGWPLSPTERIEASDGCPRCGTPREASGRFCGACGTVFADALEARPAALPASDEVRARAGGRRVAAVLAGLVVVVVLGAAGVAGISMLSRADATPVPSNLAAVPNESAETTIPPTQPPASADTIATARPTVAPTPVVWDPEDLARLLGSVAQSLRASCATLQPPSSGEVDRSPLAIAAIECLPAASAERVVYERMPTPTALEGWYGERIGSVGISRDQDGCWNGSPGEVGYSFGRASCWIDPSSGTARIFWSDGRVAVIGSATGISGDITGLVDWWWNSAMLIPETPGTGLTQDEQAVLDQVPEPLLTKCHPYRTIEVNSSDPVGDVGAIQCDINASKILDVAWFKFTSPTALEAWFERRAAEISGQSTTIGCDDGVAGVSTWEHGRVICYRSTSNDARIRWTDDRFMTYGVINSSVGDVSALEAWWRANALR